MQKGWKEQIEKNESGKCMNLEISLQMALQSASSYRYKKEGAYYVVESEGIRCILSSVRQYEDGGLKGDFYMYPTGKEKEVEHTTIFVDKNTEWVEHRHNFFEIMYVFDGEIQEKILGKMFTVQKNEVLIMNKNIKHKERYGNTALVLFVDCSESVMKEIMKECPFSEKTSLFFDENNNKEKSEYIHYIPQKAEASRKLIEQLLDEQCNNTVGKKWMTLGILARLLTVLDCQEEYQSDMYSEGLSDNIRLFKELEDYLANRMWDVEKVELSKKFHYNANYLSHLFKKVTGMSLINYCIDHKLSYAEYLICNSEISINEIIQQIGYQNKTYFYKKFKQKYGIDPQKMRQDIQKGS